MIIGSLRREIAVENPTRTADGEGGFTETYAAASPSPVWSRLEPATPRNVERLVGNTIDAPITHIVTMRYHASVSAITRLTFGSRYLFVRGMQNVDERNEVLHLACEELG